MEVGAWLRSLGLGQCEAAFLDNAIDVDALADLTDSDLEKLGLPLGDRKRLVRAIAGVVGQPSGTIKSVADAQPFRPAAAQSTSAERRPIAVVFCDLLGSTVPHTLCLRGPPPAASISPAKIQKTRSPDQSRD